MNYLAKYRHTPKGLLTNIYSKMKERSRKRGGGFPDYSLNEFHEMFMDDQLFLKIFKHWELGGYQYYDIPSIDRKDSYRGYTRDNIQIMTWRENRIKGDRENAIRFTTPVIMQDLKGNKIKEFESTKEAAIYTGIPQGSITSCCQGRQRKTHGYRFIYRGDKFRNTTTYEKAIKSC